MRYLVKSIMLLAVGLGLIGSVFAASLQPGQKVYVLYSNGLWYNAEVTGGTDNQWSVKYESDGSEMSDLPNSEVIDRNSPQAKALKPNELAESDFAGNKPQKMQSDSALCKTLSTREKCQGEMRTSCTWSQNSCDGTYK